jgi:NAD(P)-dependent dehydrogenase (short-subunit alcohol dehydrogenase family)
MFNLTDRVALVTGAARGIGREIAMTLARCGAIVIATDIDEDTVKECASAGQAELLQISAVGLDVTSPENWASAMKIVETKFEKLDILVNNAGIMEMRSFFDTTLEDFRKAHRINTESVFIGTKAAYQLLAKAARSNPAGASIVNMSSIYGQVGGDMSTAYCASKGAITLLTKALAVDLARSGSRIRVNSVHPGGIDTDLSRNGIKATVAAGVLPSVEAAEQMIRAATPLGRMGRTDDIAGVVAFLASDAAKYMTGSEVTVDGGFTSV